MITCDELLPGDVLFFPASGLEKRFVNFYHVAIHYDRTLHGSVLIVESLATRGVVIRNLFVYKDKDVIVKRPIDSLISLQAAYSAADIANNKNSWYDYLAIIKCVIPKLILIRFGKRLPRMLRAVLWFLARPYKSTRFYICSELVRQAYLNAGCSLLTSDTESLPDDLYSSPKLDRVGKLCWLKCRQEMVRT